LGKLTLLFGCSKSYILVQVKVFPGGRTVLEKLKGGKKTVGIKQSLKAVENGTAQIIYIARDADEKVISCIKSAVVNTSLEVIYIENMKILGKACGIEVGAAVACLIKGS
jgi:large subunit ribosomal protein L7A